MAIIELEDFEFHRQKVEILLNKRNVVNLRKICEAHAHTIIYISVFFWSNFCTIYLCFIGVLFAACKRSTLILPEKMKNLSI